MESRRSHETGNHRLPNPPAGEGWPVLRAHLWPGTGLDVLLRQGPSSSDTPLYLGGGRGGGHPLPCAARAPVAHCTGSSLRTAPLLAAYAPDSLTGTRP